MTISDYAQANKLAPDIALTHMLVFSLVEAANRDEDWRATRLILSSERSMQPHSRRPSRI